MFNKKGNNMTTINISMIKDWKFTQAGWEQQAIRNTWDEFLNEEVEERKNCHGSQYTARLEIGSMINDKENEEHQLNIVYKILITDYNSPNNDLDAEILSWGEEWDETDLDFEKLSDDAFIRKEKCDKLMGILYSDDDKPIIKGVEGISDVYDLQREYLISDEVKLQVLDKFLDELKSIDKNDYDFYMENKQLFLDKYFQKEKEEVDIER